MFGRGCVAGGCVQTSTWYVFASGYAVYVTVYFVSVFECTCFDKCLFACACVCV